MTKEELVNRLLSIDKQISTKSWITAGGDLGELIDELRKKINHEPSIPSNIDEAAENELDDVDANWQIDEQDDGCTEPGYNQKQMLNMFKAGAEWMAMQKIENLI